MARVKTTLVIDADLMREVRVRAARTGRSQSDILESALREGLGFVDRMRAKANLSEDAAVALAGEVVHQVRDEQRRGKS